MNDLSPAEAQRIASRLGFSARPPAPTQRLGQWIAEKAKAEGIHPNSMWRRYYRGEISAPPIKRINRAVVLVMPESERTYHGSDVASSG